MQASLNKEHDDKVAEEEKQRLEQERERWRDMSAKAASIVETVRKEGINGGFM
jgi:hypothetical protein